MDFTNRIGHDNFVWWLGVVEDNNDPLYLGRCRVRIFGTHSPNLDLVPTDTLPWATPLVPTTVPSSSAVPLRGEYVAGFFMDGLSSQFPVMLGVMPGIPQEEPQPGVGFSALAVEYSSNQNSAEVKETVKKTDPVAPTDKAPAMKLQRPGQPTTPAVAYTVANTITAYTNSQVVHSCDFRFLINLGDLNIGAIENPITLIQQAIANAKNKAAAMIRALLAQLLSNFRIGFQGILVALNLDPTGQLAKIVSKARDVIRTINYYSRKLAEYVGSAALVVSLIQELKQVIEWIKSLPAKVLAMLKDCLTTFSNAVKTATSQIAAIPGQVTNGIVGTFRELQSSTQGLISNAEQAAASANVPNTLITLVTTPANANSVNVITEYITSEYPNSNVIVANSESSSFNVSNTSTP